MLFITIRSAGWLPPRAALRKPAVPAGSKWSSSRVTPASPVTGKVLMAVLRASNLAKSYKQKKVVLDVSLEIRSGEIVGLLGPNGVGKTTCFYMIVGLVPADRGRITIDSQDITPLPMHGRARKGIGYLPQERSEEHTSELQSRPHLVCRLLLEKK